LNVLRGLFANNTTMTKVTLEYCDFGNEEESASQLLSAFQTNRTVTDLTVNSLRNLSGAVCGNCISGLLLNMPQLQRLQLGDPLALPVETFRVAFLGLSRCGSDPRHAARS
jgi:hypothetical protein